MNSVLLHGIRRPNAVVLSSTSFYARAVRLQSSEPEHVAEEEHHNIEGHPGAFSGDGVPPPDAPQRNGNTGAYRANGNATSRLPWENMASKLPPKANHVNGNHGHLEALSRSRAAREGLGSGASDPFPWDTLAGAQRPPASRLNADSIPRAFAGEGAMAAASCRESPQQEPRRPSVSQDLSLQSRPSLQTRRQNNNRQNSRKAEARLPWERMLDVLPPKTHAGANGLTQSKACAERIHESKLEGIVNGLGGPIPNTERSLNGSVGVSGNRQQHQDTRSAANRTHENRDSRSEPAVQRASRPRPGVNGSAGNAGGAMPWMLPATQDSRASDVQKQRETLDKMMAGGRYGGSHASHRGEQGASRKRREVKIVSKEVQIPAIPVPVRELAAAMSKKASEVVSMLRQMGEGRVSPSSMVDPDIAHMVAKEFGLRTKLLKLRENDLGRTMVTEASFDSLTPRPPVVSVMGHVDHGKTTLLDALRSSKVAGTESAGITQKIGAFAVDVKDTSVTFFDTPGHAAFKSMRHATSRFTDIVIVVVAADDGVKSQTVEVFKLLKEFPNLAPVVAVTKIDRYGVDASKAVEDISRQLLEHEIITEGYGGEVPIVPVSAVTQEGMDDLLETLVLQAEVLELRADGEVAAEGVVVDSAVVRGKGAVADILVTWGRLKPRDVVVAGTEYGKVRMLVTSCGRTLPDAYAAQPVRIVGMKGLPRMGDDVLVVQSESEARAIVAERRKQQDLKQLDEQAESLGEKRLSEQAVKRLKDKAQAAIRRREKALYEAREAVRTMKSRRDDSSKAAAKVAEEWASKAMKEAEEAMKRAEVQDDDKDDGPAKCFAIFKAEGFGMLEAMSQVITEVPQTEVELTLVRADLGAVSQSDVEAAALSGAPIFAFNVGKVPPEVKAMAQKEGVQIYSHDVIYRFLDDVKTVMSELLRVEVKETILGEAKTLQVYEITGRNKESVMVAGLAVSSGKLSRTHLFRVLRDDVVVAEGIKAASIRRHKDRVSEVTKDKECGVALEGFNDFQEGDVLQCYKLDEIKRQL